MGRGSSGINSGGSTQKVARALRSIEDRIRGNSTESAVVIDENGNVLFDTSDGKGQEVTINEEQMEMARGQILTHNHPHGYYFSGADIASAIRMELKQMRATTPDGRAFILERTANGKPDRGLYYAYKIAISTTTPEAISQTAKALGVDDVFKANISNSERNHKIALEHTKILNKWLTDNAPTYGYKFREEKKK